MKFLPNLSYLIHENPELLKHPVIGKKIIFWQQEVDEPSLKELSLLAQESGYTTDQILHQPLDDESKHNFISGEHIRVLATTVNQDNQENIELVPIKAKAGYACGYGDPDYLKVLPAFQMPFLSRDKKYRSFEIEGDSMPPLNHGDMVTGEFIRNWNFIKDGYPYILITRDEGIVFKIVMNHIQDKGTLKLFSTNSFYDPYEIEITKVLEVWKFVNYITSEAPELPKQISKKDQLNKVI